MTTTLVKGQNMPVTARAVQATVDVARQADLSALLVAANGKVRSDADFIFYNQPDGPGVSCRQAGPGQPWRVTVDLNAVPADVERVRIVVSLDGTGQRFGQLTPPVAHLADASGAEIAQYMITGLGSESILIAMELYRRNAEWKVRAVGQGYAGGLADLIKDHGVSVDDEPASARPASAASPTPPPAPPAPPGPPMGQQPSYPPPAPPAPPGPPMGQQPSYPPYPPAAPGAVAAATGEAALGRPGAPVNLTKGQQVSLRKQDGSQLALVRMGLGWDPIKRRGMFGSREIDIDLDASAIMYADDQPVDLAFYNQLRSKDGSVMHTGDNRTGHGEGDDESIVVDLSRVPAHVTTIVFVVTSYQGHTFQQVENAFCRLVDEPTNAELARYTLSGGAAYTAMVMAKVYREGGAWKMMAIGEGLQGRTPIDLVRQLGRFL